MKRNIYPSFHRTNMGMAPNWFNKFYPFFPANRLQPYVMNTRNRFAQHQWEMGNDNQLALASPLTFNTTSSNPSPQEENLPIQQPPRFDLNAIGGYETVIESLIDIIQYLQDPKCFSQYGIKLPKGIILSGPPGMGKTVMAEAVAGQAGVPIFMLSASEFQTKYVGDTEKKIRTLFKTAASKAPCVVCIDEIDAIASKREDSQPLYHKSHVGQLLATLSQDYPGVVIFATTNHYESLDPALIRPGRFDRHIKLSHPTLSEREKILTKLTHGKTLDKSVSITTLAQLTEGFSGAKLERLIHEAALIACRKQATISRGDFDDARTIITIGTPKKHIADSQLRIRVATHEIGHALVGYKLGFNLYKVVLTDSGPCLGYTEWVPKPYQHLLKTELLDKICMLWGARASEELSGTIALGSYQDIQQAKQIASNMMNEGMLDTLTGFCTENQIEKLFIEQKNRARTILHEYGTKRQILIEALANSEELSHEEFRQIVSNKSFSIKKDQHKKYLPPPRMIPSSLFARVKTPALDENINVENVAKFLRIHPEFIENINSDSSNIIIKFSLAINLDQKRHLQHIANELQQMDINAAYISILGNFKIHKDGMSNFINLLKSRTPNGPGSSSSSI